MAALPARGVYYAWLLDMVGAQRNHSAQLLGFAASTFPTKRLLAQIAESLLQAAPHTSGTHVLNLMMDMVIGELIYRRNVLPD